MMHEILPSLVWNTVAAFILTYALLWLVVMSPLMEAFTDRPNSRKVHQRLIPRAGGICILLTVLGLLLVWHQAGSLIGPALPEKVFGAIALCGVLLGGIGLVDDTVYVEVGPWPKLIFQFVAAVALIVVSDVRIEHFSFLGRQVSLGFLSFPLSLLWLVGVTNAINIIDGIDALAGTVSLLSFCGLALVGGAAGRPDLVLVSLIFAGALIAFLLHNAPPARTFLGDTGSMFIGMSLGALSLHVVAYKGTPYPVCVAFLLLGLPILDTATAMVRRFLKAMLAGTPVHRSLAAMVTPDNEHIHHRLLHLGLRHAEAVCVLGLFHASLCGVAVLCSRFSTAALLPLFAYLGVATVWLLYHLSFFDRVLGRWRLRRPARLLRRSARQGRVAVVQPGRVLAHALRSCTQTKLMFDVVSPASAEKAVRPWVAAIVENHFDNTRSDDIALARRISAANSCPVFVLTDSPAIRSFELLHEPAAQGTPQTTIAYVKKPIYVPAFIKRLVEHVEGVRYHRAFDSVMGAAPVTQQQTGALARGEI